MATALATFDYDWVGQTRRPTLVLRPSMLDLLAPLALGTLRIGAGALLGAGFGLSTTHGGLWVALGGLTGVVFNLVRGRGR